MTSARQETQETWDADRRPTLALYVSEDCDSCRVALGVAERAKRAFPGIHVNVIDLDVSSEHRPEGVFAVPTFVLDGEIVSLGTPSWERLVPLIEAALVEGDA